MSWTAERFEQVKSLWASGKSAKEIAQEIGGVTRSAVIGKLHRSGCAMREKGYRRPPKAKRKAYRRERSTYEILNRIFRKSSDLALPKEITPPEFLGLTIFKLKQGQCRYPRGVQAPYLFCGQPVQEGSSYCAYCHSMTHARQTEPIEPKKYLWRD